jgi:hypothetical protein
VPIIDVVTPKDYKKWRYLDSVYGNPVDGIEGDSAYQAKVKLLRRFRWCQLRNPLNALLRSYGPNGEIESYIETESAHQKRREISINGEHFIFTQTRIFREFHWWWGYKLLNDPRTTSALKKGQHFENQMILWPIKNKRA